MAIHPAAAEDGVDYVDDDCDGSYAIRRDYVTAFETLAEFNVTNSVAVNGVADLNAGPGASVQLKAPLPFESGELTVVLEFDSVDAGVTCGLHIATASSGRSVALSPTSGVQTLTFSNVDPGDDVTSLRVSCSGPAGSHAYLDWLTAQNGPYAWAPFNDVSLTWSTMGYPGGGYQTFVRLSEEYDGMQGILMMGSDVGGFAWTPAHDPELEPTNWRTANGRWDDLLDGADYAVWDAVASCRTEPCTPSDHDVYVITGDGEGYGGLWAGANLDAPAEAWELIDSDVSAFKHRDECPGEADPKEFSSGRILREFPVYTDWLVIGSRGPKQGVLFYENGSATLPASKYDAATLPTDAIPSAIEPVVLGDQSGWLLVGYRTIVTETDAVALYICPADFDPSTTPSPPPACVAVVDGDAGAPVIQDVRDIEVDHSPRGSGAWIYVADGGRRFDGTACAHEESTVYAVEIGISSGTPTFEVWDTDFTSTGDPTWSGGAYYGGDACVTDAATIYGDLAPPTGKRGDSSAYLLQELSTITLQGDWLFAFYPAGDSGNQYACVRMF